MYYNYHLFLKHVLGNKEIMLFQNSISIMKLSSVFIKQFIMKNSNLQNNNCYEDYLEKITIFFYIR